MRRENLEEIDYVDDDDYEEDRLKQSNQSNKFLDEIKDDEQSNRVYPYSGKRHTERSNDNEPLDSAQRSGIKSTSNQQGKDFSAEKYSPMKVENDIASLTMEKIANLKEFSKDMFVMGENERKSPGLNTLDYSDTKTKSKLPPKKSEEQEASGATQSKSAKAVKKPESKNDNLTGIIFCYSELGTFIL